MNKLLLENKVCIITGASRGIGYAIAKLFVEEGAKVIMNALHEERLQKAADEINEMGYPGKAVILPGDAADEEISKRAVKMALEEFGRLDILINNVGIGETTTIDTTTTEHFEKFLDVNLRSAFFFNREVAKHFARTKEGVIINISSINGVKPGSGATYCLSKGAVNTLTRNMAIRFAGTKVRVNAISPGLTDTDQPFQTAPDYEGAISMRQFSLPYINEEIDGHIPPIGQAYGALYLASEMGEFVTGQNLIIEKGRYFG